MTADALHTQRAHAHFLVEQKDAHYVFTVKKDQPIPYAQLKTLPWDKATAKFYDRSHGNGRAVGDPDSTGPDVTALGIDFPHAARIVRHRTCVKRGRRTRETVYVLTDLTSHQASPERLAKIVRSQWTIENRLHFVSPPPERRLPTLAPAFPAPMPPRPPRPCSGHKTSRCLPQPKRNHA